DERADRAGLLRRGAGVGAIPGARGRRGRLAVREPEHVVAGGGQEREQGQLARRADGRRGGDPAVRRVVRLRKNLPQRRKGAKEERREEFKRSSLRSS